jgi:hypothetical protein
LIIAWFHSDDLISLDAQSDASTGRHGGTTEARTRRRLRALADDQGLCLLTSLSLEETIASRCVQNPCGAAMGAFFRRCGGLAGDRVAVWLRREGWLAGCCAVFTSHSVAFVSAV